MTYKAFRWVEFIGFTHQALLEIQEQWKNIPQIESISAEDNLVCFEFSKYVPKDPNNMLDVKMCHEHNNRLADFTMRRLKESINRKCRGLYFNLKRLTIRKL